MIVGKNTRNSGKMGFRYVLHDTSPGPVVVNPSLKKTQDLLVQSADKLLVKL